MKLTILKEHDDGSADVELKDIDNATMTLIIQTGFIKLMADALEMAEKEKRMPALFKKSE